MKRLPMVDRCPPHCGQCCTALTPITPRDVERLVGWLNEKPKRLRQVVRHIDRTERDAGDCPFLDGEKRCAVYDGRPLVCRLFGHMKPNECTREEAGDVRFTKRAPTPDEIDELGGSDLVSTTGILAADIAESRERAPNSSKLQLTVSLMSRHDYRVMMATKEVPDAR